MKTIKLTLFLILASCASSPPAPAKVVQHKFNVGDRVAVIAGSYRDRKMIVEKFEECHRRNQVGDFENSMCYNCHTTDGSFYGEELRFLEDELQNEKAYDAFQERYGQ